MHAGKNWFMGLAAFVAVFAVPASAQRPMEIDIGAVWEHPHSGIIVPSELGGLKRGAATEFSPDFLNIGFSYLADEPYEEISLYIYRHTSGDVPVWFEQARTAIEIRESYSNPYLAFQIETFGWPGAEGWQGQQAIYATPDSSFAISTGVALFSLNGWLVKMRASSATRDPEELRSWMGEAFAELTPPKAAKPQSPPIAVTDCAEKLVFAKKAKDAKRDGAAALLGGVLGKIIAKKAEEQSDASDKPKPATRWCRDAALSRMEVAYRANGASDAYLLAISDSGIGVSVGPDPASSLLARDDNNAKPSYAITVITDARRINYVPQDRLPSPKRVLDIIGDDRLVSSTSTWGDDEGIEVNSDAL